uniref:hypothetical protein n=1 Tax=Acetatifactor sp. TaxID=1872090 RepID=UPI004057498F
MKTNECNFKIIQSNGYSSEEIKSMVKDSISVTDIEHYLSRVFQYGEALTLYMTLDANSKSELYDNDRAKNFEDRVVVQLLNIDTADAKHYYESNMEEFADCYIQSAKDDVIINQLREKWDARDNEMVNMFKSLLSLSCDAYGYCKVDSITKKVTEISVFQGSGYDENTSDEFYYVSLNTLTEIARREMFSSCSDSIMQELETSIDAYI